MGLGTPVSISETFTTPSVPFDYRAYEEGALGGGADVATPITPGEQEVAVTIQVQFAIEG